MASYIFFVVIVATRSFGKSFDLIQANSAAFEYETQTRALIERLKVLFVCPSERGNLLISRDRKRGSNLSCYLYLSITFFNISLAIVPLLSPSSRSRFTCDAVTLYFRGKPSHIGENHGRRDIFHIILS